jgi:ATP-dependent DNA helicase RecG
VIGVTRWGASYAYNSRMPDSIKTEVISLSQVAQLLALHEGQFYDLKAKEIQALKLSKAISAFANTDGGDLYIGHS